MPIEKACSEGVIYARKKGAYAGRDNGISNTNASSKSLICENTRIIGFNGQMAIREAFFINSPYAIAKS
jgi:hypothetical protein